VGVVSSPENGYGVAVDFGDQRFQIAGGRQVLVTPPEPIPVLPVKRPEARGGVEPKPGDRGLHPHRGFVKTRPNHEQRNGVAADRVVEPDLMLNVRDQAAIVETGEQSLHLVLFELGQHGGTPPSAAYLAIS